MGFKANARKRRQAAAAASGPDEEKQEEYVGEKKCDVADCDNWADKKIGGRRLAFDRAVDVWGESGLSTEAKRVTVCKSCYRSWKKAKKDEPTEWT
jgi:hypothetical protein|tara:strand:- start:911 stop:1198 length:288 start_codon:yes stop_codon:yes gene_type:complete